MDREELIHSLIESMHSIMKGMHGGQGFPFGEFTLNMPQARILFYVARQMKGLSVKELAETLNVTPGAITQFVDVLVEKGLVTRKEDPSDRRILRIKLTKVAQEKFAGFRRDYFTTASRIFGVLTDKEVSQLSGLLSKLDASSDVRGRKK